MAHRVRDALAAVALLVILSACVVGMYAPLAFGQPVDPPGFAVVHHVECVYTDAVALLPDRASVEEWLREHPDAEVSGIYRVTPAEFRARKVVEERMEERVVVEESWETVDR